MYDHSVLLIDKPLGWTSFAVVKKLRYLLGISKIGHAGTLDPLATGLLIVCTGKKTKEAGYHQEQPKVYEGSLLLGKTTPSFDLETSFDSDKPYCHTTSQAIYDAAASFVGRQWQTPPAYSALKLEGKRAYKQARAGKEVNLRPRLVDIYSCQVTHIKLPYVGFTICCGKGVYIRSIAHDLGQKLGTGACLASLRRTQIGSFQVADAHSMEEFIQAGLAQ